MSTPYEPAREGLRALGRSPQVAAATMAGARKIAAAAAAENPKGRYVVEARLIPSGWANELRAGAVVREVVPGNGFRTRALARAAKQVGR